MSFARTTVSRLQPEFVLIGHPVAHSLSPIMHNALYDELGRTIWPFASWHYTAIDCPDEESASYQIDLVRTGKYRGMNITMPYKRLALDRADYADSAADAAGGANVLVRNEEFKLFAYNTDGRGAIGAIESETGVSVGSKNIVICGTGPTSLAIAAAAAEADADRVLILSRDGRRANSSVNKIAASVGPSNGKCLAASDYEHSADDIVHADIIIDATPRGMHPGDEAIIDTDLLHEGQIVLDTVYAHGETALLAGAREHGAIALDGLGMLVEQAALSVEIWAHEMALIATIDRSIMKSAALHYEASKRK